MSVAPYPPNVKLTTAVNNKPCSTTALPAQHRNTDAAQHQSINPPSPPHAANLVASFQRPRPTAPPCTNVPQHPKLAAHQPRPSQHPRAPESRLCPCLPLASPRRRRHAGHAHAHGHSRYHPAQPSGPPFGFVSSRAVSFLPRREPPHLRVPAGTPLVLYSALPTTACMYAHTHNTCKSDVASLPACLPACLPASLAPSAPATYADAPILISTLPSPRLGLGHSAPHRTSTRLVSSCLMPPLAHTLHALLNGDWGCVAVGGLGFEGTGG
jgi:hypothetical protein